MKIFKFKTTKDKAISCILILLVLVFVVSVIMLERNIIRGRTEQSAFDELKTIVDSADTDTQGNEENVIIPKYAELSKQNKNFAGWLKVSGTRIDYPVMCNPDDPNFYLHRSFDGSYSFSGTPFLGADCTVDSDCVIIHGHNMNNGTMFGTLDYYRDKSFCEENPVIKFDTLYEQREYKVFAAVQCEVVAYGKDGFEYYEYGGELSNEQYDELVQWLLANSFYDMGVYPVKSQQILILSTCSYQSSEGRFIVAAFCDK